MRFSKYQHHVALLLALGVSSTVWANKTSAQFKVANHVMATQQKHVVKGIVTDKNGEPLIGASVQVQGTSNGAMTDIDGRFELQASKGDILVVSYVGYTPKNITLGDQTEVTFVLEENSKQLNEVVVTALGIKRSERALSYNVQKVGGDQLTGVKEVNFVNSLNGSIAGVNINASTTGVGGPTRVVMRGSKSITGSNGVLYVIDGVPMLNPNSGDVGTGAFAAQSGSEGISDLNPEDIESVTVLTGPSAAALYGSAAANGVIMINTKQGKEGKVQLSFSSSNEFMRPFILPKFQNTYGSRDGAFTSWGDKLATPSNFDPTDIFKTGHNYTNSLTLTTGTKTNRTFVSVAATNAAGILPNNEYNRYNFSVRNTSDFLNDRLHLDVSGSYIIQKTQNMYRAGQYYNPLVPTYLFSPGNDWGAIQQYKRYDAERKFPTQYWNYGDQGMQMQNPYFIMNDMMTPSKRKRYMFAASLKYDILSWLNVAGRVRVDNATTESESRYHATGTGILYAGDAYKNGMYAHSMSQQQQTYMDIMLNADKQLHPDWHLTANLGASLEDIYTASVGFGGNILKVPNIFSSDALDPSNNHGYDNNFRKRGTAVFASSELSYKDMLYLTVTGRNDWSSLLVNAKEESFFYPSVGISAVLSRLMKLPKFVSFAKVRASYTEVGSPIPDRYRGVTRGTITLGLSNGVPAARTIMPFYDFKAERTRSYELGLNLRMFESKLNFDFTWYHSNTYNQTFPVTLSSSAPYSALYVQSGNVQNQGIEMSIGYNDKWGDFGYSTNLVYGRNVNKIKRLVHGYDTGFGQVIDFNHITTSGAYLREGDSMNDVYVTKVIARDKTGEIAVDKEGNISSMDLPNGEHLKIGHTNPDFTMGWRNTLTWKDLSFSFLINGRFGGIVTSSTQAIMDQFGVSQASADARDAGGVVVKGGKVIDPKKYYAVVGGQQLTAYYNYDATNIRLQEMSLSYALPRTLLGQGWPKITLSLIGRNLIMFYNKAPFDPEVAASTGTYGYGSDYFSQPSLRSMGFSVKVNF